jgi:beta-mannosidase
MKKTLNGHWQLLIPHLNQTINAHVPGSVYLDLLESKLIPDPFYRTHEYEVREWMRHDYIYERSFETHLSEKDIYLVCEGIDTIANISINNVLIARTINMHLRHRFPIKHRLHEGTNTIRIHIESPIEYIEKKRAESPYQLFNVWDAMKGYIHIRKAHSMFGWDWGPQLPDAGIFRTIELHETANGFIDYVKTDQHHHDGKVDLTYQVFTQNQTVDDVEVVITDPDGHEIHRSHQSSGSLTISNPKYWFPVGYGEPFCYQLVASLKHQGEICDSKKLTIGLKTSSIKREKDQYGESFTYVHNGVELFLKGANYIPEDSINGRTSPEKTRKLLTDAVKANHNTVRVWGGGLYPSNDFYEICDELGLIVWQDFMFACSFYNMEDTEWVQSVEMEIKDNLKRFMHHPSIGILCGNNENETAAVDWNIPSLEISKKMYLELFENLIPSWIHALDVKIPYWPSSPSSGGNFYRPNFDGMGDMHYWGVWHNNEPIEYYRKVFPRFMSEFGIQSFPDIETVKTFTRPQDHHIYTKVMKSHQKNRTANKKIIAYMRKMFKYPDRFEDILYVSQLIQAEGVRYGVEHFRRHYGRTMGSIYWQLNDCWPVASWSSIDYLGRWKALHYHSKKFYQPVLLSIEENKRSMKANIVITNDTASDIKGTLEWVYETLDGKVIAKDSIESIAFKRSSTHQQSINCYPHRAFKKQAILYVSFKDEQGQLISNMTAFVQDKDLELKNDGIQVAVDTHEGIASIHLISPSVKRFVQLKYQNHVFSDNYVHLRAHQEMIITFETEDDSKQIMNDLFVRSLVETTL